MSRSLTAQKLSESALEGFKRFERFRKARAYAVKEYIGEYMAKEHGMTGERPINLTFLAIRALVPNLVQKDGMTKVLTKILQQREYAEKMGLALSDLHEKLKMHRIVRAAIVDMALGGLAVFKTSLDYTGSIVEDLGVDPMQIYTQRISLDDMTVDPLCRDFSKANFVGHRIHIERARLMKMDGWDKDLIRRLPRAGTKHDSGERAEALTQQDPQSMTFNAWQDYVNIVEIWVPEAESVCYIPDPEEAVMQDFLNTQEYYGPPDGAYTFGSITQPVPDNPFPVAPVGVWRDLGDMANRLFKKGMDQADRQKNVGLYNPANYDAAMAVQDAIDGEWVASEDPNGVNVVSYEGANENTMQMTQNLYGWFNLVAGNPDMMSGSAINSDKATGQQILQQNASVSTGDMRDMIYDMTGEISGKQAWFLHNDDLMFQPGQPGIPLIKRLPTGEEQQLYLTPDDKTGSIETLGFEIVQRSMSKMDPVAREQAVSYFTLKVLPQAFSALSLAMQAGQQFNISTYLSNVAEDMGIAAIADGIWTDPGFQARMQWHADMLGSPKKSSGDGTQNGGLPVGGTPPGTPTEQFNQSAQATAAIGQQNLNRRGM